MHLHHLKLCLHLEQLECVNALWLPTQKRTQASVKQQEETPHAHAVQNIFMGVQSVICVELLFLVRYAPRMDLNGMLTKYSVSLIKPPDLSVPDKLNKVGSC